MLRANLRYFNVDHEIRSLVVTSSAPGEGKTTVAWNLAAAATSAGKRSLLLEADLRRPGVAHERGLAPSPGLAHVLAGQADLSSAIQRIQLMRSGDSDTPSGTLDVVVAGALPPNPMDLLESDRMRRVISDAEQSYDLVVIDTPPTSVVSDAIPLLKEVSGVLVVIRLGKSARESVTHLRNQLRNLSAPTLGIVINAVGRDAGYGYGYALDSSYFEVGEGVVAAPAETPAGTLSANGGADAQAAAVRPQAVGAAVRVRAVPGEAPRPGAPAANYERAREGNSQGGGSAAPRPRSGGLIRRLFSRS
jgi:capsular exopolysaccharide synthesis family protein